MTHKKKKTPTIEEIEAVMDMVEDDDLPDGAYWHKVHEILGLDYGDVFSILAKERPQQ